MRRVGVAVVAVLAVLAGCGTGSDDGASPTPTHAASTTTATPEPKPEPLAGKMIVIDPGHQLGNAQHPVQINRPVDAGGVRKACNTTGTATNAGYPEATFVFAVATNLRDELRRQGARVELTRTTNSRRAWGPCVDVRGKTGNRGYRGRARAADLKLSLHGDGGPATGRGFHVIVSDPPYDQRGSGRLALAVRAALRTARFPVADYVAGGDGLDRRTDLGTLNLSKIPTAMIELGNMRNAADARVMTARSGRQRYARALAAAVRRYLG